MFNLHNRKDPAILNFMIKKKSVNSSAAFILTLLLPFVGLITSLRHWRQPWAKNVFWIACVYLGAVFIYLPEGTILGDGADGGRYVLMMQEIRNLGLSIETVLIRHLVSGELDFYYPVVAYFVSLFTDNGHFLFTVFAFVFGFFYSRNIWYVLERLPKRKFGWLIILVSLYFLVCPISGINGVRMWTALHIYVYAVMPYLWERDKSKLWLLIFAPLVHFSFIVADAIAFAFVLLPDRFKSPNSLFQKISLLVFVVTMFVSSLNLTSLNSTVETYAPEAYGDRVDGYLNDELAATNEEFNSEKNWYVTASGVIHQWCCNLLVILMFPLVRNNSNECKGLMNLYLFVLLLGSAANVLTLIPSGGRFQTLADMFKMPLILLVSLSVNTGTFKKLVKPSMFLLIIPLVVEIRKLFGFFGITAILGNFITTFFWENNVALIDFLKRIV